MRGRKRYLEYFEFFRKYYIKTPDTKASAECPDGKEL